MDANMIQQLISQIIRLGLQFILVMFIALILIGMAVALLVRIPILWITMAFMPLMFISFVLGDLLPTDFNTMQLIFKKFVHAAFLPAVLAVPLSVGFILINGLANSTAPDSAIMLSDSLGPILPGVNDLWEFLWVLVTIVVMWKGFKAALKVDSIFEQATSGITGIGDNIGKLAMNAPLSIPIIPMGKDANGKDINISLGAAKTKLNALQYAAGSGRLVEEVRGGLGGGSGTTNNINHVVVNTAVNTAVSSAITASNGNVLSETDLNAIVIAMRNANRNNPENINDTMMSDRIYDLLLAQNVNASQIERDNINAALASNPN
jgi:hypothetical protein